MRRRIEKLLLKYPPILEIQLPEFLWKSETIDQIKTNLNPFIKNWRVFIFPLPITNKTTFFIKIHSVLDIGIKAYEKLFSKLIDKIIKDNVVPLTNQIK